MDGPQDCDLVYDGRYSLENSMENLVEIQIILELEYIFPKKKYPPGITPKVFFWDS